MLFATLSSSSTAASPVGFEGLKRISPFSLSGEDWGTGFAGSGGVFLRSDLDASLRTVGCKAWFRPRSGNWRRRRLHALHPCRVRIRGLRWRGLRGRHGLFHGNCLGHLLGSWRGFFDRNGPAYLWLPKLLLLAKDHAGRSQKEDSDSDAHYSGLLVANATFQIFAARQISSASTT